MMVRGLENTGSYKESVEREKGRSALRNAKEIEKKKMAEGWRNVKVEDNLTVFVPCDKEGNPTSEGKRLIKEVLNR